MAQQAQQGLLPSPDGGAAPPVPAPRGGRGGRGGNRRRGRGGGRNINLQPRQPLDAPLLRQAGPPAPQHLATVSTPERNDPLWTTGLGGCELQPMPSTEYVYPSCEVLPQLTQVMHLSLTAASAGYARRIPESALSYYAAVCTTYRLLHLQRSNSLPLSLDEDRFVEQVASMQLECPPLLAHYLSGFGNTRVPSGRDIRFRMLDRPLTVTRGEIQGWFGRVSAETQALYASYPCLAVYAARVLSDVNPAAYARDWTFPDEIVPNIGGGVRPSTACLGYAPRARLSPTQIAFIEGLNIVHGERFPSANRSFPISIDLLNAVKNELRQCKDVKLSPLPTSIVGSQGQLGRVIFDNEFEQIVDRPTTFNSPYLMPNEISALASAFGYRVYHDTQSADIYAGAQRAPWVVWEYELNEHAQWEPLIIVGNRLRDDEPDFLQLTEFHTTSYLVRARLEEIQKALSKT